MQLNCIQGVAVVILAGGVNAEAQWLAQLANRIGSEWSPTGA